ncbi:MAG: NAD-dependent epimerase/dehydratase family protein [Anaerolineae bacterium]|nr:NAD-dependent epimerase/dehydratase family protein [Anaerolineae bacterium]
MARAYESVLITGGAGFIGSHLVEAMVRAGKSVTVADNLANGSAENLAAVRDQIDFYELDIREPAFEDFVQQHRFDAICHLAANAYVPPSVEDPTFDFNQNLAAPFRLLELLRKAEQRPLLVVMSSAAVYGNPARIPILESDPTVPISPYGVGKLALERYVAVFSEVYGIPAASLRLFSVFGPRQKKQIVFDFLRKLTTTPEQLVIIGDGTQMRDLVYVEDVVQAVFRVLENGPLAGEVYNVAAGRGATTLEIGQAAAKAMGLDPEYVYTGSVRPGDADKWIASIDAISTLGFVPQYTLESGIARVYDWYRNTQ